MIKDYGKICASSKSGKIFFGKAGTILWKDAELRHPIPIGMPCQIIISWSDPTGDLDICAFWTKSKGTSIYYDPTITNVGWSWTTGIPWPADDTPPEDWPKPEKNVNGYMVWWDGDNRRGGPERARIDCKDKKNVNDTFEVRCNWYKGHGTATLTIKDDQGNVLEATIHPSEDNQAHRAEPTDHGFIMHFSKNGILTALETV